MIKTLMYHKVKDYSKWKKAFEEFSSVRKAAGELSYSCGQVNNDPNNVYVINEWHSEKDYQAFMKNPKLEQAMKKAGVIEAPHSIILNESDYGHLN